MGFRMGLQEWHRLLDDIEPVFRKTARNILGLASIQWLVLFGLALSIGTEITTVTLLALMCLICGALAFTINNLGNTNGKEPTEDGRG